ncbi:MAG: hypothetical protein ABFD07_18505 [Methanobacterium sp.]
MTEKERRLKLQREALSKIKELSGQRSKLGFVKEELPRVSKSTLNALVSKEILIESLGSFGEEGPVYYHWTGKEVE